MFNKRSNAKIRIHQAELLAGGNTPDRLRCILRLKVSRENGTAQQVCCRFEGIALKYGMFVTVYGMKKPCHIPIPHTQISFSAFTKFFFKSLSASVMLFSPCGLA
jgi:hypothetical protein